MLQPDLLGIYINPDEIEKACRESSSLNLSDYGLNDAAVEALEFIRKSSFLCSSHFGSWIESLTIAGGRLDLGEMPANSYLASVIADFLRHQLLKARRTFTFETVMSHVGKVELLREAQNLGYRTYLYYIATDDPLINISRVANRVRLGGHPVPQDKIVERYYRSLALLLDAIKLTNRAYIFDNSDDAHSQTWLAEITRGTDLELKIDVIPAWFQREVLDKLVPH
ncbi:hypothetical protein [Verrucomicrobium spinosum]|uniref:hypothetical protein n=1 Tax=Verrucomicrobium spinosum TaxID=2736 RepID=UPI0001744B59|nr:hypothetical protein [Verrucomicrobium spinosum]